LIIFRTIGVDYQVLDAKRSVIVVLDITCRKFNVRISFTILDFIS